MNTPVQKIIFGSPGTGKSYHIKNEIAKELDVDVKSENYITTVFHPEYTYGDFMGKLMPYSVGGKVEYNFYAGHFIKALGQAIKNWYLHLKDEKGPEEANVILVIDEINRGNSAAIFGTAFQLLDRNKEGWSEYPINLSRLETNAFMEEMGVEFKALAKGGLEYKFFDKSNYVKDLDTVQKYLDNFNLKEFGIDIVNCKVAIPPNLHIVATMNTSDNSIYFMDNAFKRRWDWEFRNVSDDATEILDSRSIKMDNNQAYLWRHFVDKLNVFIRSQHMYIRKIEDKQIGYFFINKDEIGEDDIKNKLMFFLWDSVFTNNKQPLSEKLGLESTEQLVTFGDFAERTQDFVSKIMNPTS